VFVTYLLVQFDWLECQQKTFFSRST